MNFTIFVGNGFVSIRRLCRVNVFLDGLKAPTTVGVLCCENLMGPTAPSTKIFIYFSFNLTCEPWGPTMYRTDIVLSSCKFTRFLRLTLKDLEGRRTHITYITVSCSNLTLQNVVGHDLIFGSDPLYLDQRDGSWGVIKQPFRFQRPRLGGFWYLSLVSNLWKITRF